MKKTFLLNTLLLLCALVVEGTTSAWADATEILYSENFGTPSSNTEISSYTGWSATTAMFNLTGAQTVASCYSGGKVGSGNASTTSNYSVASGGGNAWQQGTANTETTFLTIQNIKITGKSGLTLYFAIYNGGSARYIDVYSQIDSGEEVKLSLTGYGNTTGWHYVSTTISGTGSSLKLIFKHKPTKTWISRVDDILLTGIPAAPAAPTFDPISGDFSSDFTLHLACATDGADMYYTMTTDGSTPDDPTSTSTAYVPATGISVSAGNTVKVKAIAIKGGIASTVASATYTYKDIANPLFSSADGSTLLYGESVSLSCATDGAKIYYTQGATPADPTSASTEYTTPIVLTAGTTIKAIAINGSDESDVVSATYSVKATQPTFSVAEGTYNEAQSITLSCTTDGAAVYYSLDGTTPTSGSTAYTGAITIDASKTIKAIAVKDGLTDSEVSSATYTLKVLTPTFSLAGGDFDETQTIELSCATDGATIHYTTNGAAPTTSSPTYSSAISVSTVQTIKAIAIKDGWANSEVASAEYRVALPATLPFSYDGNGTGSLPNGLTPTGLGTYKTSPKMQFDGTGDNLILKFNAAPTELSFKIKGNSFSGGTFKVQYSANGSDYTDLATYTTLGDTQTETFDSDDLPATTRFIKWIYTSKSSGNVGLGAINLTGHVSATMGTNGYTTFADKHALDLEHLPSGLTAYKAGVTGTTVTFTEIKDQAVPANTGLLLKGEASETYNIPVAASGTDVTGNAFLVNTAGTTFTGDDNYYYFGLKKNTLTFGLFDPASVAIPANKAYLKVSKSAGARELTVLFDDEATGIEDLTPALSKGEGVVFDMMGRRVVTPAKGLYIVNGRKVFVK
ncbi:chitobiase/beta-hexosaminidase C-terminal domain-containing protein [Xylanibacter brevis]|uniref:chitobiase/beta-hexosaminidase C-terminal domain-containing protein n=1 Tax=Xylanibacter brevis TaxID=83231 RepID=UPI00047F48FC|nr:chitobiase/beta-hexosaminidase C-terminal domain-containing protein [Xylanibacter brevis]